MKTKVQKLFKEYDKYVDLKYRTSRQSLLL